MRDLDRRLTEAIAANDDQALDAICDELEAAGQPQLAEECRTRRTEGLRDLLSRMPG
jgi:hypothetical protein